MNKSKALGLLLVLPLILTGCSFFGGGDNSKESSQQPQNSSSQLQESSSVEQESSSNQQQSSSNRGSSTSNQNSSNQQNSSSAQNSSSTAQNSSSAQHSSSNAGGSSSTPSTSTGPKYNVPEGFTPYKTNINIELGASLSKVNDKYDLEFAYDDSYFYGTPEVYDQDLSLLSFAASVITGDKASVKAFYESAGFTDIRSYNYDMTPTATSIGYNFAYKKLHNDTTLLAISIRGFNYGMEWADNFNIGEAGDHAGFDARGAEVSAAFGDYFHSHGFDLDNSIVWLTGYSRGGAVANMVAYYLSNRFTAFVYTFEAPAAITPIEDEGIRASYSHIHNIMNSADIVSRIPPEQYELSRIGVDHDLATQNYEDYVAMFDETIEIPPAKEVEIENKRYSNDVDIVDAIIDRAFNYNAPDSQKQYTANTRQEYVDRYQDGLCSVIGYIFALSQTTRDSLLADLTNLGVAALSIIMSGQAFADFLKPYLDQDGIEYDEEKLPEYCQAVDNAALYLLNPVLLLFTNESNRPAITRILNLHYPEVTYSLLKFAPHNF